MFERVFFNISYLYDSDLSRLNSEIDERARNDRNQWAGEVVLDLSSKSSLKMSIRRYRLKYQDGSGDLRQLNQEVDTKSIYYFYGNNPALKPFVGLSWEDTVFPNPEDIRNGGRETLYFGFRGEIERRLDYKVEFGAARRKFDFEASEEVPITGKDDWRGSSYVNYELNRLWSVHGGFNYTTYYSYTGNASQFYSMRYRAGFLYLTKLRFRVGPNFSIGNNDYDSILDEEVSRKDKIMSADLVIKVPLRSRNLEWDVRFGYLKKDSDVIGQSDEGFTFMMNFNLLK